MIDSRQGGLAVVLVQAPGTHAVPCCWNPRGHDEAECIFCKIIR